jgi:hypothetical protein
MVRNPDFILKVMVNLGYKSLGEITNCRVKARRLIEMLSREVMNQAGNVTSFN